MTPPPVTTYVLKVASRCNLACSYCYMYEGPDQSWRRQPHAMSTSTLAAALRRIGEYSTLAGLDSVSLVIHGGEPLLLGPERLRSILASGRDVLGQLGVQVNYSLQTNATLVRPSIVYLLEEFDVAVGISLDGSADNHDRRRTDHSGHGSYDKVVAGLRTLQAHSAGRQPYSAISVIDVATDPADQLRSLLDLGITRADFLLPDLNWESAETIDQDLVGDWLVRMFSAYMESDRPIYLRTYQTIMKLMLGGRWGSDAWGESSAGTLIIETDGEYHYHDALKTAFENAGASGKSVHVDPVEDVARHPMVATMTQRLSHLATECRACQFRRVCGGGHIVHRYSPARGFDNPSVYCQAIKILLSHVGAYLESRNYQVKV